MIIHVLLFQHFSERFDCVSLWFFFSFGTKFLIKSNKRAVAQSAKPHRTPTGTQSELKAKTNETNELWCWIESKQMNELTVNRVAFGCAANKRIKRFSHCCGLLISIAATTHHSTCSRSGKLVPKGTHTRRSRYNYPQKISEQNYFNIILDTKKVGTLCGQCANGETCAGVVN